MADDDFTARLDRLLAVITRSHDTMLDALRMLRADTHQLAQRVAELERQLAELKNEPRERAVIGGLGLQ